MTNITALREKIAQLANQANHILAEKGDQVWSKEDQTKFDYLTNQIEQARDQVKAIERMRELDADKFFDNASKQADKNPEDSIDAMQAVALYLRNGGNVSPDHNRGRSP